MAVAVLGVIVLSTFGTRLSDELSATSLTPEQQQQILDQAHKLGGITIPEDFTDDERMAADQAIRDSFVYGFRWAMGVCALLAGTGAAVSIVAIRAQGSVRLANGDRVMPDPILVGRSEEKLVALAKAHLVAAFLKGPASRACVAPGSQDEGPRVGTGGIHQSPQCGGV